MSEGNGQIDRRALYHQICDKAISARIPGHNNWHALAEDAAVLVCKSQNPEVLCSEILGVDPGHFQDGDNGWTETGLERLYLASAGILVNEMKQKAICQQVTMASA